MYKKTREQGLMRKLTEQSGKMSMYVAEMSITVEEGDKVKEKIILG